MLNESVERGNLSLIGILDGGLGSMKKSVCGIMKKSNSLLPITFLRRVIYPLLPCKVSLIITLKCAAYTVCILICILHSTVANTKESESKVFDVISYNNMFVETDKTFEFSTSEVKYCTVVTSYNAHLSINYESNQTWYKGGRIYISLEDPQLCCINSTG